MFRFFFEMLLLKKNYIRAERFQHTNRIRSLNFGKEVQCFVLESYKEFMLQAWIIFGACSHSLSAFIFLSAKGHTLQTFVILIVLLTKRNNKLSILKEFSFVVSSNTINSRPKDNSL